ncbi:hypothetical protein Tco_0525589 [Tanacetum coccineum]
MNYIPVSIENQVNVDASTQDSYVAGEDVAPAAHEKPSESSPKDNDVQDSEDVADKEGQHQMTEDEQVLYDDLENMIAQEVIAKALDDATRQAFEEEKRHIASQKRVAQDTSTNKLSTVRSSYVSAASTSTCANADESSFVYLGGKIPIDASTLPNADLPIDPNMPDLEDDSDAFSSDEHISMEPISITEGLDPLVDLHLGKRAIGTKVGLIRIKWMRRKIKAIRRGTIDKTLFIKKKKSDIMLVQVYVDDIIFGSTKKSICTEFKDSTTPIESNKPLVKDEDVDVHVYRSMIGSLMYLTSSRPDIMFDVCAYARFQVTPKASHLNAVKRIFRYLKHQPKLGLWYPRDSPFELEAYSDSDYGGASLDRKSTTGGCQFLGRRLISWQCKKQTIMANSTTEAEYVVAANCCGQVLWIQNQMMDYGFNFMNTKIHIDNESTISVIKNPVAHSRTKHIEIRFHFIRDCYEKRLIEVIKIHTDSNVADLLTKGFDVTRFNFLVVSIGIYLGFRESLERDIDGTEELLLPDLFILWLTKVSTDSANLVPLGEDSTAIKPLEKIPPRASIGSDLLFDDADGIDSLHNQAIFDAIQLMGYERDLTVTDQAKEIKHLKAQIKKLKKKAKPVITHHKAWMKSVSMKQRLAGKKSLKTKWMQKEYVSKQGRKPAKAEPTVHKDPAFDDLDDIVDNAMDYMEDKDTQDEGRTSFVMLEEKESAEKGVSIEDQVSTVKPDEGTNKPKVSTDKPEVSTDKPKEVEVSTDKLDEGTVEQMNELQMKQKESLNQLAKDEEIAKKMQEDWEDRRGMKKRKKHVDLKNKNFEEIQVLYEKVKRPDKNFIAIGSTEDERQIKEMNEEAKDYKKKKVVKETPREEDIAKVPAEQEVIEQGTKKRKSGHVKMIARKRPRLQPVDDSDDEHKKFLRIVTFDSTIDSVIKETKSFVSKLHEVSSPDGDYLVQYSEITPEGIKLILWGDLKIMIESSTEENDQGDFLNNQQEWEIFRWRLYEACRVCILELKDGTVIYMLVERMHPLSKELLQRMLDLGLEVEEESTDALHLSRINSSSKTSNLLIADSLLTTILLLNAQVKVLKEALTNPKANGFLGKDKSNPLIVDSLLKTIRLLIHLVVYNEELAIPEQTATGKGISNPLGLVVFQKLLKSHLVGCCCVAEKICCR